MLHYISESRSRHYRPQTRYILWYSVFDPIQVIVEFLHALHGINILFEELPFSSCYCECKYIPIISSTRKFEITWRWSDKLENTYRSFHLPLPFYFSQSVVAIARIFITLLAICSIILEQVHSSQIIFIHSLSPRYSGCPWARDESRRNSIN